MSTNILPARENASFLHYWRLVYYGGKTVDEPAEGGSIKDSPADAIELHVMKRGAGALLRIELPPGTRPVWYRKRSMDVKVGTGNGSVQRSGIRLDATVFGFVEVMDSRLDENGELELQFVGKLRMLYGDREVNVPPQMIDPVAISNCWRRE